MSTDQNLTNHGVEIVTPGLYTTVQDLGRTGYYNQGLPPSGAMDVYSLIAGNLLVGNPEDAAGLECALLGPTMVFRDRRWVAVTGAAMTPAVDKEPRPLNQAFVVEPGQTVTFGPAVAGARAYVAISGGIDVPVVLGSRSTYALGSLGGLDGRQLQAGDVLPLGTPATPANPDQEIPEHLRTPLLRTAELRIMRGLHDHLVTPDSLSAFFESPWQVASEADRIGYRLKGGPKLEYIEREQPFGAGDDPSNITDACYPVGSIQVPAGKEPIILHRDAVSGGGYMMVGAVISADMHLIGQLPPGATIQLVEVDLDAALAARKERNDLTAEIRELVAASN